MYQNGNLILETEIESKSFSGFQLISIDNAADVIYVCCENRLWSVSTKGQTTSLGSYRPIYPDYIMECRLDASKDDQPVKLTVLTLG